MSKLKSPLLIAPDGALTPYPPKGAYYTLQELQEAVNGYIELVKVAPIDYIVFNASSGAFDTITIQEDDILVVDEEGHLKPGLAINPIATTLFNIKRLTREVITGRVLLCQFAQLEEPEDEEEAADG